MTYYYNSIGNRILEIRGKMGALERVRKENLQRGNFEKARILERERNELEKEYIFTTKRIKKIIKKGYVTQGKHKACFVTNEKFCGNLCYFDVLGKCYLYYLKRGGETVRVDTTMIRQCGVCEQMVFQGDDILQIENRLFHKDCARKLWQGYRNKFIKKNKEKKNENL